MVKIGYPHAREFAVTGAREQCAAYDPAQRLGAGIDESAALDTVEMADAGGIGSRKGTTRRHASSEGSFPSRQAWLRAALRTVRMRLAVAQRRRDASGSSEV